MILVEKHIINKNHNYFNECDILCFKSKNLYNHANYLVRQEFIKTSKLKESGELKTAIYLSYQDIRRLVIKHESYTSLPRKVSNQILMLLDKNWKSFFKAIKDYMKNKSKYLGQPKLPRYKHKVDGRNIMLFESGAISTKELKNEIVKLSGTNIRINTSKTNIKMSRIIPRSNHYVIEIVYEFKEKQLKENNGNYAGIDLGLNNLATISSNKKEFKPLIINGKPLKSINQYYNKRRAKYASQLNKEQYNSKRIIKMTNKRNNKVNDYLHKSSRYIINQLVSNNINTLIVGNNKEWKQEINIGKRNNQNFVNIPHSRFIDMLKYKCQLVGINFIVHEESYTSKCSFLDEEEVKKHVEYKGKRIKRGLFRSSSGRYINADLNGSYNIIRKVVPDAFNAYGIEGVAVHPTSIISL